MYQLIKVGGGGGGMVKTQLNIKQLSIDEMGQSGIVYKYKNQFGESIIH